MVHQERFGGVKFRPLNPLGMCAGWRWPSMVSSAKDQKMFINVIVILEHTEGFCGWIGYMLLIAWYPCC